MFGIGECEEVKSSAIATLTEVHNQLELLQAFHRNDTLNQQLAYEVGFVIDWGKLHATFPSRKQ